MRLVLLEDDAFIGNVLLRLIKKAQMNLGGKGVERNETQNFNTLG